MHSVARVGNFRFVFLLRFLEVLIKVLVALAVLEILQWRILRTSFATITSDVLSLFI